VEVSVKNEETGQVEAYAIPYGKHLVVYEGDRVAVGEALTDGAVDMHDLLSVKGVKEVQNYIVDAIQEVYRLQGVNINDKYIEIVVRQMLSNVKVTEPGGTTLLKGEIVNKGAFKHENEESAKSGHEPAQGEPVLLGISKASLASESFISAASFQETTKVLTEAALAGKTDRLVGLKENVILGHLVPAGTGFRLYQQAEVRIRPQALEHLPEGAESVLSRHFPLLDGPIPRPAAAPLGVHGGEGGGIASIPTSLDAEFAPESPPSALDSLFISEEDDTPNEGDDN
jgi:DNA-directed RNA polymerase subunit beta'